MQTKKSPAKFNRFSPIIWLFGFLIFICCLAANTKKDTLVCPVTIRFSKRIVFSTNISKNDCQQQSLKKRNEINFNFELKADKVPFDRGDGADLNVNLDNFLVSDNAGTGIAASGTLTQSGTESEQRSGCQTATYTRTMNHSEKASLNPGDASFTFQYDNETKAIDAHLFLHWQDFTSTGSETVKESSPNGTESHTNDLSAASSAMLQGYAAAYAGSFQLRGYRPGPKSTDVSPSQQAANQALDAALKNLDGMAAGGPVVVTQNAGGFILTYSRSVDIPQPIDDGWQGTNDIKITTSIQVFVATTPPKIQAILEPLNASEYDQFLPEGPAVDGSTNKGNMIGFRLKIVDVSHPDQDLTQGHPFTVSYTLQNVTKYTGYCMNYPKKELADDKPDLRFDSSMYVMPALQNMDDAHAQSKPDQGGNLVMVYIRAYDYAAYGELTAHVSIPELDLELDAHSSRDPGKNWVAIPEDDNGNKIADAWEKQVGIWGKNIDPKSDDDGAPTGQRDSGDGYTVMEEYRGFYVEDNALFKGDHEIFKNHHIRTDPQYKDCFVYDRDGLFKDDYAGPNPAQLNWHYVSVDKNQLIFLANDKFNPEHRWINFDQMDGYFYAKQYCVVLFKDPGTRDFCPYGNGQEAIGVTYNKAEYQACFPNMRGGNAGPQGEMTSPMRDQIESVIYMGAIKRAEAPVDADKRQAAINTVAANAVRHEVGHFIGIAHHHSIEGDGSFSENPTQNGALDCIMRYPADKEETTLDAGTILAPMPTPFLLTPRIRYCRGNENGYEFKYILKVDAKGNPVLDTNKNQQFIEVNGNKAAANDNCWGQIKVKSEPQ